MCVLRSLNAPNCTYSYSARTNRFCIRQTVDAEAGRVAVGEQPLVFGSRVIGRRNDDAGRRRWRIAPASRDALRVDVGAPDREADEVA